MYQTKKLAKSGINIFGTLPLLPFQHSAHDILSVTVHIPSQFYDMPKKSPTSRPGCKQSIMNSVLNTRSTRKNIQELDDPL